MTAEPVVKTSVAGRHVGRTISRVIHLEKAFPLPTMTRPIVWIAIAVALVSCQAPLTSSAPKPGTPRSVILQPGDLPGMHGCDISGQVTAVLTDEKSRNSPLYERNATEWQQWKRQGAIDAYFAV